MLPYYTFLDYYVPCMYQTLLPTISVIIRDVFSSTFTEDSFTIISHIYNPAVLEETTLNAWQHLIIKDITHSTFFLTSIQISAQCSITWKQSEVDCRVNFSDTFLIYSWSNRTSKSPLSSCRGLLWLKPVEPWGVVNITSSKASSIWETF